MKRLTTLFIAGAMATSMLFAQKQVLPVKVDANVLQETNLTRSILEREEISILYAQPDSENRYSISFMTAGEQGASYFPTELLNFNQLGLVGKAPQITGIGLAITEYTTEDNVEYKNKTFTMELYEGTYASETDGFVLGTKKYSSSQTLTETQGWLRVDLETPLNMDLTKGYTVAFIAEGSSAVLISGVDDPTFNGLGNFFYDEERGAWVTIYYGNESAPVYYAWTATLFVSVEGETVSLTNNQAAAISVYPNPATDIVYIENAAASTLRVLDMTGKVVLERNIQNVREGVEVNHLNNGIYFIEVVKDNEKTTQKLIKK